MSFRNYKGHILIKDSSLGKASPDYTRSQHLLDDKAASYLAPCYKKTPLWITEVFFLLIKESLLLFVLYLLHNVDNATNPSTYGNKNNPPDELGEKRGRCGFLGDGCRTA